MRTWIIIDGEKIGPFDIAQVARRIESGELSPETYGWIEGMKNWQPLSTIPQFSESCHKSNEPTPPPLPVNQGNPNAPARTAHWQIPFSTPQEKTNQLLRRFFARWFDLLLWSSLYMCVMKLSGADLKSLMMNFWFNYVMMLVWIMIEAAMIHVWGFTPGKALLGLRVHRADGSALSLGSGLLRSIRVYLMGMGMSHPLLLPLCHGFAWWFVRKHGVALWDGAAGHRISVAVIKPWRWVIYGLLVFTILNVSGVILESVSRELFIEMFPEKKDWLPPAVNK